MTTETRTYDLIPGPPIQTKIYPLWLALGFAMVVASLAVMAVIATVAGGVFDNPKAVRDAADVGSALLARQGDLATYPLWVQPFKFLGISILITGILTAFWGVLRSIRVRGEAMVDSIPLLVRAGGNGPKEVRQ